MSLFKSANEIAEVHIGSKEIQGIYLGSKEIWTNTKVIYLGEGTTFDVTKFYSKYSQLTVDDFFFTMAAEDTNIDQGIGSGTSTNPTNVRVSSSMNKTYNASTGQLTCKYGSSLNSRVWLIPNSSELITKGKIISLSSAKTWNMKNYAEYDKAKKDNFLFRTLPNTSSTYQCYGAGCPNWCRFAKKYTDGTLSSRVYHRGNNDGWNVNPFYILPSIMK